MAVWKKLVVLGVIACLTGFAAMGRSVPLGTAIPVRAADGGTLPSPIGAVPSVVVPVGAELQDAELLEANGDSLIAYMLGGGVAAVAGYLVTQISHYQPVHCYTALSVFFIGAFSCGAMQYSGGGW